jgi:hypothetical protein
LDDWTQYISLFELKQLHIVLHDVPGVTRFQLLLRVQIWTFHLRKFIEESLPEISYFSRIKIHYNGRVSSKTEPESAKGGEGKFNYSF